MSHRKRDQLCRMFDPADDGLEERYKGEVQLTRRRKDNGEFAIAKSYSGAMQALQGRELALLSRLLTETVTLPSGATVAMKSRVTYLDHLQNDAQQTMDIAYRVEMPWHGFDLEDWRKLLGHEDGGLMRNPTFLLILTRSILLGLEILHAKGWIHGDINEANLCQPWAGEPTVTAEAIHVQINADKLKLIDLGLSLAETGRDDPFPKLAKNIGSLGRDPRLVAAFKAAAERNDNTLLKALDWRVDFFALHYMLNLWDQSRLHGDAGHANCFRKIWQAVAEIHAAPIGATLPHSKLVQMIDVVLADRRIPASRLWNVTIPLKSKDRDGDDRPTVAPPRKPVAAMVSAAVALALGGWWWFGPPTQQAKTPEVVASSCGLQALAGIAEGTVLAKAETPSVRVQDPIRFQVQTQKSGYLTFLACDPDSKAEAQPKPLFGESHLFDTKPYAMPNELEPLLATAPTGTHQVLVVLSAKALARRGADGKTTLAPFTAKDLLASGKLMVIQVLPKEGQPS